MSAHGDSLVEQHETSSSGHDAAAAVDIPYHVAAPSADIYLVGYGHRLPNDFTLEMIVVLQHCMRVCGMPPIHAPEFGLPRMESLLHFYSPDKRRMDTYREIADYVLAAAAADRPVAIATYGSAMCGALPPHMIIEDAPKHNLSVHVTNAVSCLDGIWADLNIEPFNGFEVWDATTFIELAIIPNTSAHLMLPQTPLLDVLVGPDPRAGDIRRSSTVTRLRDYLLDFYPPGHTVHYVTTSTGTPLRASDIESVPLRSLEHGARRISSTLVVPRGHHPDQRRLDYAWRLVCDG